MNGKNNFLFFLCAWCNDFDAVYEKESLLARPSTHALLSSPINKLPLSPTNKLIKLQNIKFFIFLNISHILLKFLFIILLKLTSYFSAYISVRLAISLCFQVDHYQHLMCMSKKIFCVILQHYPTFNEGTLKLYYVTKL